MLQLGKKFYSNDKNTCRILLIAALMAAIFAVVFIKIQQNAERKLAQLHALEVIENDTIVQEKSASPHSAP